MRLINADEIVTMCENVIQYGIADEDGDHVITAETMLFAVNHLPTVDTVTVRHGRWIKKRYWSEGVGMGERYGYYYSCSKCGNWVCGGYDKCGKKYCDECGALMDGKDGGGND